MVYDNLFKDRVTWGRPYACVLNFVNPDGTPVDMTPVTAMQMDFKASFDDASALFSLTASDGLSWMDDDPTKGSLQIYISAARVSLASFPDQNIGEEIPSGDLYGDLKLLPAGADDLIYDEGTVPKLFLTVEKRISGA